MSEKANDIKGLALKSPAVSNAPPADALARVETVAYVLPPISQDPAASFLAACTSARTQQTMREGLARIEAILGAPTGSVPWAGLRHPHVKDIRARLQRQYSARTVNVTMVALRGVLRSAWELELLSGDDYTRAIAVKGLKVAKLPKGRALPRAEWSEIEAYCRSRGPEARDWPESAHGAFLLALFSILFGAGLRASEAASLTLKGFDVSARTLRFVGKGSKERMIPLGDAEHAAIEAWIAVRAELDLPSESPLLVHVRPDGRVNRLVALNRRKIERICKRTARAAGVAKFSPHDLRRTFMTEALAAGTDLATVQRFAGHESPETTAGYDRRPFELDAVARRKFALVGRDVDAVAQRARVLAALAKR